MKSAPSQARRGEMMFDFILYIFIIPFGICMFTPVVMLLLSSLLNQNKKRDYRVKPRALADEER